VVVQPGNTNTGFVLQRAVDFDSVDDSLNQAQVFVTNGNTWANKYWHQTNSAVMDMGFDPIVFAFGQSAPTWTVQVADQAALEELSYAVTYGTPVLVTNTAGSVESWRNHGDPRRRRKGTGYEAPHKSFRK
jgi:hypothetical protein